MIDKEIYNAFLKCEIIKYKKHKFFIKNLNYNSIYGFSIQLQEIKIKRDK